MNQLSAKRFEFLIVAAMALSVMAASCGSDSDDTLPGARSDTYSVEASTTMRTVSITRVRFVRRMNKACRKAWPVIVGNFLEYVAAQAPEVGKRERIAKAIRGPLLAGIDFYIFDYFRYLGAPPGDERKLEEIIGPMQVAVELGEKRLAPTDSIAQVLELFEDYNRRAGQYGLDDCLVKRSNLKQIEART